MKSRKITNTQFLKKVEELKKDKNFTYTDASGKVWGGEMAIAKHFDMTRAEYRAKLKEAKAEVAAKKATTKKKSAKKPPLQDVTIKGRVIACKDDPNGRYYIELPDGHRLIYTKDGYQGWYNPELETAV